MDQAGEVRCPICNAEGVMRIQRNGFMQQNILWHLGIYPWKCGECGSLFLFRRRGHRRRRSWPVRESGSEDYNRETGTG